MAYSFYGFIGPREPIDSLASQFSNASIIELPQNLFLVPLVDELLSEINKEKVAEAIDGFYYFNKQVESVALQASLAGTIAYAEVLTVMGDGDQDGLIWDKGTQIRIITGEEVINSILRHFKVIAYNGQDEFLTMGFGLRRFTDDWIET